MTINEAKDVLLERIHDCMDGSVEYAQAYKILVEAEMLSLELDSQRQMFDESKQLEAQKRLIIGEPEGKPIF